MRRRSPDLVRASARGRADKYSRTLLLALKTILLTWSDQHAELYTLAPTEKPRLTGYPLSILVASFLQHHGHIEQVADVAAMRADVGGLLVSFLDHFGGSGFKCVLSRSLH